MQMLSRKLLIPVISSVVLPYGAVSANTMIFTTNQYWLFPLWTYIHDFGNWLRFGVVVPPFLPSFSYLPPILGLIWLVLGLTISRALFQFYSDKRDGSSLRTLTIAVLLIQIIGTIVAAYIVWDNSIVIVIPLPLHPFVVLYLFRNEVLNKVRKPFDEKTLLSVSE